MVVDCALVLGYAVWSPTEIANTLVVIDGKIPIGQSYSDMGGYYMMPVGAIESVEVIKGASPALYGSGSIGGVVNIITKKVLLVLTLASTCNTAITTL